MIFYVIYKHVNFMDGQNKNFEQIFSYLLLNSLKEVKNVKWSFSLKTDN